MDNLTDKIYQLSLDTSWLNDQFGDVESAYGWNGLIIGKMFIFVISVDSEGFKYLDYYWYKINGLKHIHGIIALMNWEKTKEAYYQDLEKEYI